MKKLCLALFVTAVALGCSGSPESSEIPVTEPAQLDVNPVEGAWRLTALANTDADGVTTEETPQQSLIFFGEGYYSMAYGYGDQPFPYYADRFNPTDEEHLARMKSMVVNAGTYEVEGSKLLLRPLVARSPGFAGGLAEHEFELSGDTLTLTWGRTTDADGLETPLGDAVLTLVRIR